MFPSSSSSSQHSSSTNNTSPSPSNTNLTRYDSAPSSFLSNAAESITGLGHHHHPPYFSGHGDSLSANLTESTQSKLSSGSESRNTLTLLRGSYGLSSQVNDRSATPQPLPNLIRHSSSPAGFLNHLTSDIGFSVSKGVDNYNNQGASLNGHKLSRLGSQLSFTKQDHHSLSQISEVNECMLEGIGSHENNNNNRRRLLSSTSQSRSTSGFSLSAWDDSNNGFTFSGSSSKRAKNNMDDDILNGLAAIDSQQAMELEMAAMERLIQIPQDSVPCKIRAKRGFATHPRSIAERERRTRISGKLKKLQDLVPNMDKQTSYADMLDLAVQHIKGLQSQIQKLNDERDCCTCGCKQDIQS